jgi:mono/diheme cytochrome c family protein
MAPQHQHSATAGSGRAYDGRWISIAAFLVFAAIAVTIVIVRRGAEPDLKLAAPAQQVAAGQQLYATRCASCHGAQLEGAPGWPERQANGVMPAPPLDARSPARERDDAWIFSTVREGGQATAAPGTLSTMPAFGGPMSDEEIWAVISYLKSSWPP